MNMEIDPASSSVKLNALVNASLEWIESSGEETKPKPTLLPIAHKGLRAIKLLLDQTPCLFSAASCSSTVTYELANFVLHWWYMEPVKDDLATPSAEQRVHEWFHAVATNPRASQTIVQKLLRSLKEPSFNVIAADDLVVELGKAVEKEDWAAVNLKLFSLAKRG